MGPFKFTTLLFFAIWITTFKAGSQNLYTQANAANIENEANAITGWTGPATITSQSSNPQNGTYSLQISVTNAGRDGRYTFTAVPGTIYNITIWARRGSNNSNSAFNNWTGFQNFSNTSIATQIWTQYNFTLTASSTNPQIRVYGSTNGPAGRSVFIDGITITAETGGSGTPYTTLNANLPTVNWQALDLYLAGNSGIGSAPSNSFALSVNGSIRTKEFIVQPNWSDFVFHEDYKLMDLKDVEQYIQLHGHLLDIPSAEEVAQNGIGLGELNQKLLQKIEELTLYVIDAGKRLEALKADY